MPPVDDDGHWYERQKLKNKEDFNSAAKGREEPSDKEKSGGSEMVASDKPHPYPHPKGPAHTEAHRPVYYEKLQRERDQARQRQKTIDAPAKNKPK